MPNDAFSPYSSYAMSSPHNPGISRAHSRTSTSTQGILNCLLSKNPLTHSIPTAPPLPLPEASPTTLLLTLSMALLAMLPPVPLIAVTAMLAVSIRACVSVEFPFMKPEAVSEAERASGWKRGSNQSAWKSKREKTRTPRRMLQ